MDNLCKKEAEERCSKVLKQETMAQSLKTEVEEGPSKDLQQETMAQSLKTEVEEGPSKDLQQKKMDHSFKKEGEEGSSKPLQQEAEAKKHKLQFCLNSNKFSVSCNTSMTVLEALITSQSFRNEKDKKKNKQKEILILRSKSFPKAAVKTDFPCCLIETDEILEIDFIQKDGNGSTNQTTADPDFSKPETLVTFWVKKDGGQIVQCLLKSKALRNSVHHVCVYAFKGEKIKTALKRDGRFRDDIFQKHCALSEFSHDIKHELSNSVDDLNGKDFQIVVVSDKNQQDSQDDWTLVETEPNAASDADVAETVGSSQNPIDTRQEKKQDGETKSTNPSTKQYVAKLMVNSEEILGILRDQFPDLLNTLKQRKKLMNKSEVQTFFRAEYGKSVENFLKVKKVKQLMRLSDSVCQIRQGGSALGTGFLLFDRYILTNAHVIGESADVTKVNAAQFTAVFGYEDLDSDIKHIPVKQLTAYFYGKNDKGRYLDYALLELDDVENIAKYTKLLDCHRPNASINGGQICIVGHPLVGEGVKKMDPCFIIERENQPEAANKHASENQHLIHVMSEVCLENKWDFSAYENKFTYDSCFFHGSSGSPVFDVDCNLIGIHTGGYKYKTEGEKQKKTWSVMEYGFSMQPILENIRAQARIKGLTHIVSVIDAHIKQDIEMESAEKSKEN